VKLAASIVLLLAIACPPLATAQGTPTKEYQIKAVFLFNFIQFTAWPDDAFPNAASPIRIGILGQAPFGDALHAAVQGEKIGQRAVTIEQLASLEDAAGCHVVFVGQSEANRVPAIISALAGRPVLTVGDVPDFARRGGMINFYLDGPKVRFEINRAATLQSRLRLSSQLLGLARLVNPQPNPGGN
jgi:hypothetical protein